MDDSDFFTEQQKKEIGQTLAQILTGRGKEVEDIAKEINETMFPLTDQQIKDVDSVVEAFVYGGGVQEELPFPDRLKSGLDYITQKLTKAK